MKDVEEVIDIAYDFDGVKKINIGLIRIPEHLSEKNADKTQIDKSAEYLKLYGMIDIPIEVSAHWNMFVLRNGSPQYWASKKLGMQAIEAICLDGDNEPNRRCT